TFSFTFNSVGSFPYHCKIHASMTATITVNPPPPDFSVACAPATVNAAEGSSGNSTCTITSINSFNSPVTLSTTGLPMGATSGFLPAMPPPPADSTIDSTLTVNVAASVGVGDYAFMVKGVSGALSHTFNMTLHVTAGPDFTVTCDSSTYKGLPGS